MLHGELPLMPEHKRYTCRGHIFVDVLSARTYFVPCAAWQSTRAEGAFLLIPIIYLSDPPTMSTFNTRKSRKARSGCEYTPKEREVIRVYKEEYREQTSKELRGLVFRTKILPDIFNYWTNNGAVSFGPDEVNQRVQASPGNEIP